LSNFHRLAIFSRARHPEIPRTIAVGCAEAAGALLAEGLSLDLDPETHRMKTALALVVAVAFSLLLAVPAGAQLPLPTPSLPPQPPPAPLPTPAVSPPLPTPIGGSPRSPRRRPRPVSTDAGLLTPITISGNQASVTLSVGGLSLDLDLVFESVSNLTATSLGISARIASASELASRLPTGTTAALPLVFAVEPPTAGGLDFHGVAWVYIHTHDLSYTADTPLRLYSAPLGGPFVDITETTGNGSYRASGSKGGFSEFVIVSDTRALDAAIQQKLDALQALLNADAAAIPADVATTLQGELDAAHDAWSARDYRTAAEDMESFAATVQTHSGTGGIPDEWRAARDLVDVAGLLRAGAGTLRYSLTLGE
jgi:hypothetical protein